MLKWYINQTHSIKEGEMNHFALLALGLVAISTPCFAPTPATQRPTNYYYSGPSYSQPVVVPVSWYPQNYPSNGRVSGNYYIISGPQSPIGAGNSPNNNGSPGRSFVIPVRVGNSPNNNGPAGRSIIIPVTYPSPTTYPGQNGQNSPVNYYPTRNQPTFPQPSFRQPTFPPNSAGGNQGNCPGRRGSFGQNNLGPTGTNNQNYPNNFNPGSYAPGRINNPIQPRPNFGVPSNACACGEENLQTRIINGKVAQKDRYPWMVSVLVKKGGNRYGTCGASLINDRYVLTAAHCLKTKPQASDIILMLGAYKQDDRWSQQENREKLEAESYLIHPGYTFEVASVEDVALIKLKKPVQLGNKWKPVCLPNFSTHTNLFVYGWGDQNENIKRVGAKVMHEIEIDEVSNSTCTNQYWGRSFIPEQHICAGTKGGTCQGDSGGPVSTRHSGRVYQVGVVSFGQGGCGIQGKMMPDISQRVTHHLPWIQANTRDAQWCSGPDVPDFTLKNIATKN